MNKIPHSPPCVDVRRCDVIRRTKGAATRTRGILRRFRLVNDLLFFSRAVDDLALWVNVPTPTCACYSVVCISSPPLSFPPLSFVHSSLFTPFPSRDPSTPRLPLSPLLSTPLCHTRDPFDGQSTGSCLDRDSIILQVTHLILSFPTTFTMVPAASLPRPLHRVSRASKSAILSTFRPIQQHHYTFYDLQYLFLFVIFSFCYWIMDKPVWFKLPIALTSIALLIPRRTRQFMLPFFAIAAWLLLFYCCRFIPSEWRPHIFTSVLPTLENILYGGSISEMLASTTSPFKDILAWLPYGIGHYVMPIVTAILIIFFAPPGTLPLFARTLGYMNVAGVLTQILFPCAPPCKFFFFLSAFFFWVHLPPLQNRTRESSCIASSFWLLAFGFWLFWHKEKQLLAMCRWVCQV